jgi:hypothetical protein
MRKTVRALILLGMLAALAAPSFAGQAMKIHFGVTGTFLLGRDFEGELGDLVGPGGRVDIDFGSIFTLSPEITWVLHWHTVAPACTLNIRLGRIYFGLGPLVAETDRSWDGDVFLKAHLGMRSGFWLIEAVYLSGRSSLDAAGEPVSLLGVTCGFMF